jgi:ATP-dependent Clp protease protease subunit
MNTSWPPDLFTIPRIRLRVVWGTAEMIETLCPHAWLRNVDFPAEGRPTIAAKADFGPFDTGSVILVYYQRSLRGTTSKGETMSIDSRAAWTMQDDEDKSDGKDRESFSFMEKMLKTRTILLSGEIDKSLAERVIRQLLLLEDLNDEPVRVFIDSPGGDADAGFAILDMMRFVKPPVTTIGMGLVASAGALILLAAPKERRLGLPNSHYLIHQPLSGMRGAATDIEIHAREIERIHDRINTLIAQETGKSLKQVVKDTDRDFWMNSEEAQSYGLLSRIVSSRGDLEE